MYCTLVVDLKDFYYCYYYITFRCFFTQKKKKKTKKKTSKNTAKYRDQYLRANFKKYYIRIPQLTFFRLWFSWIYQKSKSEYDILRFLNT